MVPIVLLVAVFWPLSIGMVIKPEAATEKWVVTQKTPPDPIIRSTAESASIVCLFQPCYIAGSLTQSQTEDIPTSDVPPLASYTTTSDPPLTTQDNKVMSVIGEDIASGGAESTLSNTSQQQDGNIAIKEVNEADRQTDFRTNVEIFTITPTPNESASVGGTIPTIPTFADIPTLNPNPLVPEAATLPAVSTTLPDIKPRTAGLNFAFPRFSLGPFNTSSAAGPMVENIRKVDVTF